MEKMEKELAFLRETLVTRLSGAGKKALRLQFLAHLETSFGYNEETGSRVVHKPFDGVLHLEGARGLKNAVRRRRSSCAAQRDALTARVPHPSHSGIGPEPRGL